MYEYLTNPFFGPQEGFGEQYKLIFYYAIYAELHHISFVYTPFKQVAHNYSDDPEFLPRLERLIHVQSIFPTEIPEHGHLNSVFIADLLHTLHHRMVDFEASRTLHHMRTAFYRVNSSPYPVNSNILQVAIHVRRPNAHDTTSHSGLHVPDDIYLAIMDNLQQHESVTPYFHVFSQGTRELFQPYVDRFPNVQLHLNTPLEDVFLGMVFADILVVSPSALSYTAGLLSTQRVYYIPHCNPPLPSWSTIEGYKSPRMQHKFRYETTVYFDSENNEYIIRKDGFPFGPLRIV
jgi:hypothetical protein